MGAPQYSRWRRLPYHRYTIQNHYFVITSFVMGYFHRTLCWSSHWNDWNRPQETYKLTTIHWHSQRRISQTQRLKCYIFLIYICNKHQYPSPCRPYSTPDVYCHALSQLQHTFCSIYRNHTTWNDWIKPLAFWPCDLIVLSLISCCDIYSVITALLCNDGHDQFIIVCLCIW